mgnify:CR=1 FL=1
MEAIPDVSKRITGRKRFSDLAPGQEELVVSFLGRRFNNQTNSTFRYRCQACQGERRKSKIDGIHRW